MANKTFHDIMKANWTLDTGRDFDGDFDITISLGDQTMGAVCLSEDAALAMAEVLEKRYYFSAPSLITDDVRIHTQRDFDGDRIITISEQNLTVAEVMLTKSGAKLLAQQIRNQLGVEG